MAESDNEVTEGPPPKWYHVNKDAIPAKLSFFMCGFKDSAVNPYLNLFLVDIGLLTSEAGLVSGLRLISSLLGSIFWGVVTDWSQRYRLVVLIIALGAASVNTIVPWIPGYINQSNPSCLSNVTQSNMTATTQPIYCQSNRNQLFWTLLLLYNAFSFFDGYFAVHVDSTVMSQVVNSKRKLDFGRQRAYGPIGFGTASMLFGSMTTVIAASSRISRYSIQHFLYTFSAISLLVNSHFLIKKANLKKSTTKESGEKIGKMLLKTVSKFHVIFFFACLLYISICIGVATNYVAILLRELNAPDILMGLTFVSGAVSAFIFYSISTKIVNFVGGTFQMILVSCISNVIRFSIFGYAKSPYAIVAIQLLHPFTFSLSVVAAVLHVKQISPPQIANSMFGIINGLLYGAGLTIANILGGFVYEDYGGRTLFKSAMIFSGFWGTLVFIFIICSKKLCYIKKDHLGEHNTNGGGINESEGKGEDKNLLEMDQIPIDTQVSA